jgi:hypothetical protein
MRIRMIIVSVVLLIVAAGGVEHLAAQATGTVSGIAKDALGRPLSGVQLRLASAFTPRLGMLSARDCAQTVPKTSAFLIIREHSRTR